VEPHTWLAIALIGVGVGFLSGAFGKGGSAIATPMLHGVGVPAMAAVASPLPATIPASFLAARAYAREGHVDGRVMRIGIAAGVPAIVIGASMTRWIPGPALILATDVVVLGLALRMLAGTQETEARPAVAPRLLRIIGVVSAVGLLSGLLGNGGGFLLAPLFVHLLKMPLRRAMGTSLALATVLAVPGTIVHAALGHVDWMVTLVFALGSVPLAQAGARVALRMRARALTLAYGIGIGTIACGLLLFAH
jgi:uncharacterized protein